MVQKLFLAAVTISITSIGIVTAASLYGENYNDVQKESVSVENTATDYFVSTNQKHISFPEISVNAVGLFIGKVDLNSGTVTPLYTKNEYQKLPIASISKLITTYVVTRNRRLTDRFTINDWAVSGPWPSHKFTVGDVYSLKELLKAALVESNNDAARVLASSVGERTFVQNMNMAAIALSLPDTKLYSADGTEQILSDTWVENTSTPTDIAHLIVSIYKTSPELLKVTTESSVLVSDVTGTHTFTAYSTNKIMSHFSHDYTLLGAKTGTSDSERKHFVTLFKDFNNNTFVAVVLQSKDSFADMITILDAVTQYRNNLYAKN